MPVALPDATSPAAPPARRPPPGWRECFAFPLATPEARRDVLVGGTLLLTLLPGWIFNLGHRLDVVYRLYHHEPPYFRGFAPWGRTFVRGLRAFCAIAVYLSPAAVLGVAGAWLWFDGHGGVLAGALVAVAAVCFLAGIYALPGGMTYNAAFNDLSYLYRPDKAMRRALAGGEAYLKAWAIGASAIALSFLGLLALGVGFLYTSVWAWSVVGYAFSRALVFADAGARVAPP